jgi:dephospho-CoA kinase
MSIRSILYEAFNLQETILDKNALKSICLAGSAGSGKSYIVNHIQEKNILVPFPKIIDSDKIFEAKLKAHNLPLVLAPEGTEERNKQTIQRNNARKANFSVLKHMLNGYMPILIDGTGRDLIKYQNQYKCLEQLGYDVLVLLVNTSLEVAIERNKTRKRKLTDEEVVKMWHQCQKNFPIYQQKFLNTLLIDNNQEPNWEQIDSTLKSFYAKPNQNPIGKDLLANKDKGSITRDLPVTDIDPFSENEVP